MCLLPRLKQVCAKKLVICFFSERDGELLMGRIANMWQAHADLKGPAHPDCIELCVAYNDALDAVKTGRPPIPRQELLDLKHVPVWMNVGETEGGAAAAGSAATAGATNTAFGAGTAAPVRAGAKGTAVVVAAGAMVATVGVEGLARAGSTGGAGGAVSRNSSLGGSSSSIVMEVDEARGSGGNLSRVGSVGPASLESTSATGDAAAGMAGTDGQVAGPRVSQSVVAQLYGMVVDPSRPQCNDKSLVAMDPDLAHVTANEVDPLVAEMVRRRVERWKGLLKDIWNASWTAFFKKVRQDQTHQYAYVHIRKTMPLTCRDGSCEPRHTASAPPIPIEHNAKQPWTLPRGA